jgi:hypothetical protein
MMRNAAAALVAIVCWAGLALQFAATYGNSHDVLAAMWTLARFFTMISNLALALAMTAVAAGRRLSALAMSGLTLAVLLVGVVYWVLLRGLHPLSAVALTANTLLHDVSPLLMAAYWLVFVPRGKLRWSAPWWWTLFPVIYFVYVLARGQLDHRYPYPFIDVGKLGWLQVGLNAAGIAFGFVLAGFALVWIDSWRPLGPNRGSR